jgi:transcriptional regulator with XRE-family HTH domain
MQDIVARIKHVMENEQMNAGEFADQLGIGRPLLSHVLGGRNNPSLQLIIKILDRFPAYTADWLITGKEHEYEQSESPAVKLAGSVQKQDVQKSSSPAPTFSHSERVILFYNDGTFDEFNPRK